MAIGTLRRPLTLTGFTALTSAAALGLCCAISACASFGDGSLYAAQSDAHEASSEAGSDAAQADDAATREGAEAEAGAPEIPSILSPYDPSGTLAFGRAIDWTIAALDPSAFIYYTTDGTTPSAQSPLFGQGRVTLPDVANSTTIRWVVAKSANVHSFLVRVDPNLRGATQSLADRVSLNKGAPIMRVAPGAIVTGSARAFVWNPSCTTCIDQVLVGVISAEDCLTNVVPGTYPGVTTQIVPFTVKAPMMPGTYPVRLGFAEQFKCPDTHGATLGARSIATIIVE